MRWFPPLLLIAYIILFVVLGINPYDRAVWWAENIPIMIIAIVLSVMYWRGIRLSNLSYVMASVLIFWYTVGGHYTFERVPFDWFNNFFGFERNMYDRIGHFSVGFYAYPILELVYRFNSINRKWLAYLFAIFSIMAVACFYEILEWYFAISADPTAGHAFLGSQGDEWDAQKDMLFDTLGGIFAIVIFALVSRFRRNSREDIVVVEETIIVRS